MSGPRVQCSHAGCSGTVTRIERHSVRLQWNDDPAANEWVRTEHYPVGRYLVFCDAAPDGHDPRVAFSLEEMPGPLRAVVDR